ncbi:PEP-CTERM sorting domain-containing protein [Alteromonas sp. AMM-1]|uniref:PEP-CTERM sorting domain-containing protein n=1 Tax=Alteromonas sp. AMM-1 TaxID=3394233 RepID=UPI0039A5CE60
MKKLMLGLVMLVISSAANASFIRNLISENSPGTNGSWSFGTVFTVGATDLDVSGLGAYDYLSDGFVSNGILVGLFDESDGSLLVSTLVNSSDPLIGAYRYSAISYTLFAGMQYRLVGVSGSDRYIQGNGTWTFSSDVTFNSYGYCSNTSLTSCNTHVEGDYGMANMQYSLSTGSSAPTPASAPAGMALLMLGVGLLFNRRQKAKF